MNIYDFKKKAHSRTRKMNVLVDLDEISTFYPAGMRVTKTTPKSILLAEDPRSHFNGEFWEVYPLATTPTNVYIVCPYCKMIHIHGNKAGDYEGFRRPHCKDFGGNNPDYYIEKL